MSKSKFTCASCIHFKPHPYSSTQGECQSYEFHSIMSATRYVREDFGCRWHQDIVALQENKQFSGYMTEKKELEFEEGK